MKGIHQSIFLLLAIMIMVSCRKDDIQYEEDIVIIQGQGDDEVGMQGHITDTSFQSVSGATVTIGDQSTTTNEYGYFRFDELDVIDGTLSMSVTKDDYITQYKKVTPAQDGDTFVRASLISKEGTRSTFSSDEGATITGNLGHRVIFQPNSIETEDGSSYNGEVIFSSYYIDPTRADIAEVMPGDLSAIDLEGNPVQLVSFGMLYGELLTPSGSKLQIKEGYAADIELLIPAELQDKAPSEIPLWSLDEISSTWLEEGKAIKEGNKYKAQVSHFSFWNCDAPFPLVEVSGCAVDQDGLPIGNTTIFVSVPEFGVTRYCTTDRNGCFYGKFPKSEDMEISIGNYCEDRAVQQFGPFANSTNAGVFVFDLSEDQYIIEGTVSDCDMLSVYPGIVQVTDHSGRVTTIPTLDDGSFYSMITVCSGTSIDVKGVDLEASLESENLTYELIEGINDIGNIVACDQQLSDFLSTNLNGVQFNFADFAAHRAGENLIISAYNSQYEISLELKESDTFSALQRITIFDKMGGQGTRVWIPNPNDYVFSFDAAGSEGELVQGSLSGTFFGFNLDCDYRITVSQHLTPISGVVWDDLNHNGIREMNEPFIKNVEVQLRNPLINLIIATPSDDSGAYTMYGSHMGVNTVSLDLIPFDYEITIQNEGTDDTLDSDFDQSNGDVEIEIDNAGTPTLNIDAGLHVDPNSLCKATAIQDICITGDGDICKNISVLQPGVNFNRILVKQGGSVIQDIDQPQTSPYELCGLSYNIEYSVTCFLDNGIECETGFEDLGTVQDSTFFYVRYTQCDPLIAEVTAIPNQNVLLGIDYLWDNGSTEESISMMEGESSTVMTISNVGCQYMNTYTLEKSRVAIGGLVWKDNPAGTPNVLDEIDTERVTGVRLQLFSETGMLMGRFDTSHSGQYQFYMDLPDGNYYIQAVNIESNLQIVDKYAVADSTINSDFNGNGRTDMFTIDKDCFQIHDINLGLK